MESLRACAMTKIFRAQYGTPHPVEVEAEFPAYPNHDSDGECLRRAMKRPLANCLTPL
jgi:hypothetical protein